MRFKYWKIIEKEEKNPTMKSCPKKKKTKKCNKKLPWISVRGRGKKMNPLRTRAKQSTLC